MSKEKSMRTALSVSVWQFVKSDLELRILSGEFAPGERFPSIRQLVECYNVGQTTIQKVLGLLWQEGVIEPHRGVGFFVKPYIREQLIATRKKNLEKKVLSAVQEAELIGVDLLLMVERYVQMKDSK